MTLDELIEAFRREVDDTVNNPFLWDDDEIIFYANEAEQEACRRANLLIDSSNVEICLINIVAGEPNYDLDERVITVRRARLSSRSKPLKLISYKDLDESVAGWESNTGTPLYFFTDFDTNKLRLYPAPTADDTLILTVTRLPLFDLESGTDTPEINKRFHRSLLHWIKYRAYSKPDTETLDQEKSILFLQMFEAEFGPKSSAINEIFNSRNLPYDNYDGSF